MIITVRSIVRITVRVTFKVAMRYIIKSAVTIVLLQCTVGTVTMYSSYVLWVQ